MSKFLVHLLQPLVGTISNSHIRNSKHFIDVVQQQVINSDDVMVSFDVKSLFTCVPIDDVLEFLRNLLAKYAVSLPVSVIIELVKLCVVDTCFIFNGEYFRQKFGMQMGNCLSPVMSNIYMEFYEKRIANAIITEDIFWVRYVDDCFAIFKFDHNLDEILDELNSLVPSIKFTIEKEENGCIAFLDVMVIKENNSIKFKVYRKATNNNHIINAYSLHSESIKQSALRSMFLRALTLCSPEYFDNEIDYIYTVGFHNNFQKCDIDHCYTLAKKTYFSVKEKKKLGNFLSLPFHPCFIDISYPLKLLGINVSFSFPNTIGNSLIRNSPIYKEGIVYKIPCTCGKIYVGQTGKSLEKRLSQHRYNVNRDDASSALNLHTRTCHQPIRWGGSKEIYKRSDYIDRNIIETVCIHFSKDNNINNHDGFYNLDPLLHILKQKYKVNDIFYIR